MEVPVSPTARLWIGPSGWSYDDWYGVLYPAPRARGFKPLAFLARYFNAAEVNTSFYRIPSPRMTEPWVEQVPADFRFAFKLTNVFTHTRDAFPPAAQVAEFAAALEPIRRAGRLGPLLIQFPWSFRFSEANVDWLRRLADAFPDLERIVEVRHATWLVPEAQEAVRSVGGWCNIDQPLLQQCIGPTEIVFGRTAYVRLHGRNAKNWFAKNVEPWQRYDWLYDEESLREWAARIEAMRRHAETEEVYIFANNHHNAQGPVNALELKALLEGGGVDVPPELLGRFPRLAAIAQKPLDSKLFE
jgi:uncharacterized protein YecE (DUF72 family)